MQWVPDEMEGEVFSGCGSRSRRRFLRGDVYPADFVVSRHLDDPLIAAEIRGLAEEAVLLGVDLDDPEIMGAWLKNLGKKIKSAFQKKKIKKISVSSDAGTAELGPSGINITSAKGKSSPAVSVPGLLTVNQADATGGMAEMLKNPMVISAGLGILALLLMQKKGGKK